jgi:hypothetical protein
MSKRKVTLKLTTQKDLIHHESEARTYGELKKELTAVKWDGMRVVERASKNTLQRDDAILPGGEFILFLVPEKVKSGKNKDGLKKLKDIGSASYNELRSHGSYLNKVKNAQVTLNGGTEELRNAIQAYYGNAIQAYYDSKNPAKDTAEVESSADPIAAIEEARTKINIAIDTIVANASVEDTTEYLIKTSIDDLEDEIADIKKSLKL